MQKKDYYSSNYSMLLQNSERLRKAGINLNIITTNIDKPVSINKLIKMNSKFNTYFDKTRQYFESTLLGSGKYSEGFSVTCRKNHWVKINEKVPLTGYSDIKYDSGINYRNEFVNILINRKRNYKYY
tara:strand:+ start:864 stop:1244 length:381 start_codon:yes stop_codon:yes gene_type:complete